MHTFGGRAALGICAGGLYHVSDPAALLRRLRDQIDQVLVVRTVFHVGRTDLDYFEAPAPGLTWGCPAPAGATPATTGACASGDTPP